MSEQARVKIVCPTCGAPLSPEAATVAARCHACGHASAPLPAPTQTVQTVVVERVERVIVEGAAAPVASTPRCPRCAVGLFEGDAHGVKLLGCGVCGGVFLDNEACVAITHAPDRQIAAMAARAAERAVAPNVDTRPAGLACPICAAPMQRTRVRALVDLDACPAHGTWFDRAELVQVIELYGRGIATAPPNDSELAMAAFRDRQVERIERMESISTSTGLLSGIGFGVLGVLGALAAGSNRT